MTTTRIANNGYRLVGVPVGHPLRPPSRQTEVLEHRLVLWNRIGPGEHPCHWCGATVEWGGRGARRLVVDHVNGVKVDNRDENLVPSCSSCNVRRRSERPTGITFRKSRGKWIAYLHLGSFDSRDDAMAAYELARLAVFGEMEAAS